MRSSRDAGRSFGDARTIGETGLSIDCRERLTDGLAFGLAASKRLVHVAWSLAPKGRCQASSIALRTSDDRGRSWGSPGPRNAITDVAGVRVGHATLIRGDGPWAVGEGPVRTGVTVIVPHDGDPFREALFAGCHRLNGNGELTGLE